MRRRLAPLTLAIGLLGVSLVQAGSPGEETMPAEIVSPSAAGRVVFPHAYHVDELGFECRECHHETEAAPLRTPHPQYLVDVWVACESCHRGERTAARPRSCAACHGSGADVADQTLSSKVAVHRSCWQCHDMGTGADASRGCAFCHEVADDE